MKLDDKNVWKSDSPSRLNVIKSIENRDAMLAKFRELWYHDYLLSLRKQCRDLHEVNSQNNINVGDVVLVKNPAKTRPFWLLEENVGFFSSYYKSTLEFFVKTKKY